MVRTGTRGIALAIAVIGLAPAGAAASDASCTHDPLSATTTVTIGPGGAFAGSIFVNHDGQLAVSDSDINPPDPPCGSTADTDTVAITGALDGRDDYFYISDNTANRPFAPGATDEPGESDEIEFEVSATGGTLGIRRSLVGVGSVRDTATVLGKNDINIDAAESDGIDADVDVGGPDGVYVSGDDADDLIDGDGGRGTPNQPFVLPIHAEGFVGDDEIVGGLRGDDLFGSGGRDVVIGMEGDDRRVSGGEGPDKLNGNDGEDRLFGEAGDDILKGGPGRDFCDGGAGRDIFRGCEVERG